jgi:hypothetical protein
MTELEQAQRALDVMEILAYVGFILWGCAGWYIGRTLLRKHYIKPNALINIKVVRQIEDDNFHKNEEIKELKKQLGIMEDHKK